MDYTFNKLTGIFTLHWLLHIYAVRLVVTDDVIAVFEIAVDNSPTATRNFSW